MKLRNLAFAGPFRTSGCFLELTVRENVMVGNHCRLTTGVWQSVFRTKHQKQEEKNVLKQAEEILEVVGLTEHSQTIAKNLSYGQQRRLEIARALASQPKLLLLDEPAAGMNEKRDE